MDGLLDVASWASLVILAVSALLCVVRVASSESVAERVIALDTLLTVILVAVMVEAARTGMGTYLDIVLAMVLLAFIGSTAVGRFIERRGAR